MMLANGAPEALFGGPLLGANAVRFVFVDEAGTSDAPHEKVRIVAAVILHADQQLLRAEALLAEALGAVPPPFRDGFVFHAEDIMNNRKYRDAWRLTDRVNLLKAVMAIPLRLRAPMSFGLVWAANEPNEPGTAAGFSPGQQHHIQAFMMAIAWADKWLRESAGADEIGTVVAERSDMSKALAMQIPQLRETPLVLGPNHFRPRERDLAQGFNSQAGVFRVSRIRKTIHWVDKTEDPLVWIADACAYGLKRFFAQAEFGDDFCMAMNNNLLNRVDYEGPSSVGLLVPVDAR